MEIYQGEAINFELTVKDDNGSYLPSLSGLSLEAIIKNNFDSQVVKGWSTAKGTMTIGTYTKEGTTIGYASFGISALETSQMCGDYSLEMAKVLSDGRAIGMVNGIINIKPAIIRRGIE